MKENWEELGCYCDDACATFGDCCRDSPRAAEKPRNDLKCMPLRNYVGVYVVTQCPASWPNDKVRRMCEEDSSDDLRSGVLVSNRRTGLTYRNLGCAVCHADTEEAVSWQTRLECPSVSKGSQVRLSQTETGRWGVTRMENGTETFHACTVDPFMPETLTDIVRRCEPLTDSCPDSWTDETVAGFCAAYFAKVFDIAIRSTNSDEQSLTFRNPHCALCNGVASEDVLCEDTLRQRGGGHLSFNTQAFAILLDTTEDTGSNIVGAKTVCDEGEIFDRDFIKCHTLVCDKGFCTRRRQM